GLERVDSLALDPHKWLFQPIEIGCVLVRDLQSLRETFRILPEYLKDVEAAEEQVNFCDYGIQLTRSFRALKLWLSLQVFGLDAFRAAVDRGLDLAELAGTELLPSPCWEIVTPAQMGIITFRFRAPGLSPQALDDLNGRIVATMLADGFALVTSTVLRGRT